MARLRRKSREIWLRRRKGLLSDFWLLCIAKPGGVASRWPKLQEVDGYKLVFKSLQAVAKNTEQFDRFFKRGFRKKGQPLDVEDIGKNGLTSRSR